MNSVITLLNKEIEMVEADIKMLKLNPNCSEYSRDGKIKTMAFCEKELHTLHIAVNLLLNETKTNK